MCGPKERRIRGSRWAVALLLAGIGNAQGADFESLVGAKVVTRPHTEFHGGNRRIRAFGGYSILRVEQVSGDWVELSAGPSRAWAKATEVVPCDEAIDYLTNQIEAHPGIASLYAMRGIVYEEMKEPKIALADYHEAIRLDPNDAAAYVLRGAMVAALKRDYDRALADFDRALELEPRLVTALIQRGEMWMAKRDYDHALADYDRAIRLGCNEARVYQRRGRARQANGNTGTAIEDFLEAVRLNPEAPSAHLDLAHAWCIKKDFDRALAGYNEAIRLDPQSASTYNDRGLAWAAKENYVWAIADHSAAIRIDPKSAPAYFFRGLAWRSQGEFVHALADYNEAIRLDPEFAEAHIVRAWLQATCPKEQLRNGKAAYDSAVRACNLTHWSTARDLDTLAASCAESNDFARAVDWEKKAIELADDVDLKQKYRARLMLYLDNKPFRERTR